MRRKTGSFSSEIAIKMILSAFLTAGGFVAVPTIATATTSSNSSTTNTTTVTLTDAAGNPVPNSAVVIQSGSGPLSFTTNSKGQFSVQLASGTYTISSVQGVTLSTALSLSVSSSSATATVQDSSAIEVRGTLVGADGVTPITAQTFSASPQGSNGTQTVQIQTDSQGQFTAILQSGTWEVGDPFNLSNPSATVGFTVSSAAVNPTVTFSDALVWQGTLYAEDGKTPIPNKAFSMTDKSGNTYAGNTNDSGQFTLLVPPGEFQLASVNLPSNQVTLTNQASTQINASTTASVVASSLADVNGTLTASDGKTPVSNADIKLKSSTGSMYDEQTNGNGDFSGFLPNDTYTLVSINNDAVGQTVTMQVPSTTGYNMVDPELHPVTVSLTDATSSAPLVTGTDVNILDSSGHSVFSSYDSGYNTMTDNNGQVHLLFKTGTYTIPKIGDTPMKPAPTFNVTSSTSTVTVPVGVKSVAASLGLFGPDGKTPLRNTSFQLTGANNVYDLTTDDFGNVQLNVLAGTYTITKIAGQTLSTPLQLPANVTQNASLSVTDSEQFPVSITVQDGSGNPVPNCQLDIPSSAGPIQGLWRTDADGKVTTMLLPGTYQVTYDGITTSFSVSSSQTSVNLIDNSAALQVTGKVVFSDGTTPMANTLLELDSSSTSNSYLIETDSNGNFSTQLPAGQYNITSVGIGEGNSYMLSFNTPISVTVDSSHTNLTITSKYQYLVTGKVTANGTPMANADVALGMGSGSGEDDFGVQTDSNGSFAVWLPNGTYSVVGVNGNSLSTPQGFIVSSGPRSVNITQNTPVQVNGTVITADGKTPLYNDELVIRSPYTQDTVSVMTDSHGRFTTSLDPGSYEIVSIDGDNSFQLPKPIPFTVANTATTVNLVDKYQVNWSANLVAADGKTPISYGFLKLQSQDGSKTEYTVNADSNGYIRTLMPVGSYNITTIGYGWTPDSTIKGGPLKTPIPVSIGAINALTTITDKELDVVDGTFTEADNSAVAGTVLQIDPVTGWFPVANDGDASYVDSLVTTTAANGNFQALLAPGNYQVDYINGQPLAHPYEFAVNAAFTHLSTLTAQTDVSGTLTLADGKPVLNQAITLVSSSHQSFQTTTDSTGHYSMSVPQGTYVIGVMGVNSPSFSVGSTSTSFNWTVSGLHMVTAAITANDRTTPVGGYMVILFNNDYTAMDEVTTDSQGKVSVILPAGQYTLMTPGGQENFTVGSSDMTVSYSDVQAQPTTVTVYAADGKTPMANSEIDVTSYDGIELPLNFSARTNSQGQFTSGMYPGDYTLTSYTNQDGQTIDDNISFSIEPNQKTLAISLARMDLSGTLKGTSGQGVDGGTLTLVDSAGNQFTTHVSSTGHFMVNLPTGSYTVKTLTDTSEPGTWNFNDAISVVAGSMATNNLQLVSAPTGLTHSQPTETGWTESWHAVSGVSSYNVYLNNTKVATVNGTNYTFTGESPSTAYNVKVMPVVSSTTGTTFSQTDTISTSAIPSAQTGSLTDILKKVDITSSGGTIDATQGDSHVTVDIPAGTFSEPIQVTVTTNASSNYGVSLPSGSTAAVAFGVHLPSGVVPAKPITLTITNPNIRAGDTVYKILNGKLVPMTATVNNGKAVITFQSDPDFIVAAPISTMTGSSGTVVTGATKVVSGMPFKRTGAEGVLLILTGGGLLWLRRRQKRDMK